MQRTKTAILQGLDPHNPASIQALIDYHRANLGGFVMETDPPPNPDPGATPGQQQDPAGQQDAGKDGANKDGDQPLGEGGLRALQAERDARKALETELTNLKAGLASALGVKGKEVASSEDVVATLQTQVQQMQRDNLVYQVITDPAHPITDPEDRELIRAAADETAMRKLAARLSSAAEAGDSGGAGTGTGTGQQRRGPAPDPSQGRGGNASTKAGREAGVAEAQRRFPQLTK